MFMEKRSKEKFVTLSLRDEFLDELNEALVKRQFTDKNFPINKKGK